MVQIHYVLQLTNNQTFKQMSIVDILGRTIILSGTHAFEWSVIIANKHSLTIIRFANRVEATKEFNKYKRKR